MLWMLVLAMIFGAAVGLFSGIFGLGAGIIMIPVLMLGFKQSVKAAVGTSLVIIVPTALSGALAHYRVGHISADSLRLAACIIITSIVAAQVGANIAHGIKPVLLQRYVGFVILILAINMILESYQIGVKQLLSGKP